MLTAYMDESYNQNTLCVAGWLCEEGLWRRLETQWDKRIQYENRQSLKAGLIAMSRFHASKLDNFQGDFKGWGKARKVQFQKKLIDILGRFHPVAIACGVNLGEMISSSPEAERGILKKNKWELAAYRLCMMSCFKSILEVMELHYPQEQVAVIHDHGKFNGAAQRAFSAVKRSTKCANRSALLTVAPMEWENCTALQPADLLAYEGLKLVERRLTSVADFRKSLQRIIGNKCLVRVHRISEENLKLLIERHLASKNSHVTTSAA